MREGVRMSLLGARCGIWKDIGRSTSSECQATSADRMKASRGRMEPFSIAGGPVKSEGVEIRQGGGERDKAKRLRRGGLISLSPRRARVKESNEATHPLAFLLPPPPQTSSSTTPGSSRPPSSRTSLPTRSIVRPRCSPVAFPV